MSVLESHFKNIIKANDENRLTIFVGAGISKSSNNKNLTLPSWSELIEALKKDLKLSDESDYLKIAQLYFLEFKAPTYYSRIKAFFPDYIEPSSIHNLIFEIKPQCVITTNWDNILERAIENGGYIYDVVCSDKDLVKSTNSKKIIKMHGDFKNHNIVFKEDDYLNYSHDFPLVENYIKSILATNTVLFLGYSYNDINLKQIMKWIQKHSEYSPPMYLTVFEESDSQRQYLDNHGITSLFLSGGEDGSLVGELDWRSNITFRFLDNIKNRKIENGVEYSDYEVISFVYDKVSNFLEFNFVSTLHVRDALTNCGFKYSGYHAVLEFYAEKGVMTTDYDVSIRRIYSRFVSIVSRYNSDASFKCIIDKNNDEYKKIFDVFSKARIIGVLGLGNEIFTSDFSLSEEEQLDRDRYDLNFIFHDKKYNYDISSLSKKSFYFFEIKDYKSSYEVVLNVINLSRKTKNYAALLIALFNRNTLLWYLKYSFGRSYGDGYSELKDVDLQEQFFNLPKDKMEGLKHLYDFLTLNSVYKLAYYASSKLSEKESAVKSIKKGGFYADNMADEPSSKQVDLLLFSLTNNIMISDVVYKTTQKNFIKISFVRQCLNEFIYFNQYELYACIHYFEYKELRELFYSQVSGVKKIPKLKIDDLDLDCLINVIFSGLLNNCLHPISGAVIPIDKLINSIYLLSFVALNDVYTGKIMDEFLKLVDSKENTDDTYSVINAFLANQYELYKNDISTDVLLKLTENIILKLINKNNHVWDTHAITTGRLGNLFGYIEINKGIFKDEKLITVLLAHLNDHDISTRVKFSQSLLFNIYKIGSGEVKSKIHKFIKSINISELNNSQEACYFELWCVAVKLKKYSVKSVRNMEKILNASKKEKSFSSFFYDFKNIVEYLVDKEKLDQYRPALNQLNEAIAAYKSIGNRSQI